jgi:hypothetical protein
MQMYPVPSYRVSAPADMLFPLNRWPNRAMRAPCSYMSPRTTCTLHSPGSCDPFSTKSLGESADDQPEVLERRQ